jgi:hypothetical protein
MKKSVPWGPEPSLARGMGTGSLGKATAWPAPRLLALVVTLAIIPCPHKGP